MADHDGVMGRDHVHYAPQLAARGSSNSRAIPPLINMSERPDRPGPLTPRPTPVMLHLTLAMPRSSAPARNVAALEQPIG